MFVSDVGDGSPSSTVLRWSDVGESKRGGSASVVAVQIGTGAFNCAVQ